MRIPPHARLAFKGVFFEVYQWEQEMFDGTTETFERIRRPGTAQVIAIVGDALVLLDEEQPAMHARTGLVGGVIDAGESPLEAARRELLEETGMESDDWSPFITLELGGNKMDYAVHYFIARACRRVRAPSLDPGERIAVRTVSFEEFVDEVSHAGFRSKGLTEHVLRLQKEGKLEEFRETLFRSRPAHP